MSTEVIFALVLATLFLGAIAWLVIYSRLQHRRAGKPEEGEGVETAAAPASGEPARPVVKRRTRA